MDGEVTKNKSSRTIENSAFPLVKENMKDEVFSDEEKEIVEEPVEDTSTTTVDTIEDVTELVKGRSKQESTVEVDTPEDVTGELNEPFQDSSTKMIETFEYVRELVDK